MSTYAYRLNVKLIRPSDFNPKMHEHGVAKKISVQKICEASRNEKQVRVVLDTFWSAPKNSEEEFAQLLKSNAEAFSLEKVLTEK